YYIVSLIVVHTDQQRSIACLEKSARTGKLGGSITFLHQNVNEAIYVLVLNDRDDQLHAPSPLHQLYQKRSEQPTERVQRVRGANCGSSACRSLRRPGSAHSERCSSPSS